MSGKQQKFEKWCDTLLNFKKWRKKPLKFEKSLEKLLNFEKCRENRKSLKNGVKTR